MKLFNMFIKAIGHIRGDKNFNFPIGTTVPSTIVAWNPLNTHVDITLSNNNLTLDHDGAASARIQSWATLGRSSGKYYFEINIDTMTTFDAPTIGIGEVTASLAGRIGDTATDWGWQDNGRFYNSGSYSTSTALYYASDVVQVAVDLDNGKLWFGKNNVWIGTSGQSPDPATGTDPAMTGLSGTLYPGISLYELPGQFTGTFKISDFEYTPPTGFSAWES